MVNMVLLFNFVIAILSQTFAYYQAFQNGLYFNTLNRMMTEMEWDDVYGAWLCSRIPVPTFFVVLVTMPFVILFEKKPDVIRFVNNTICYLMYTPIALFIVVLFSALNTAMVPFVYLISL
jgi:hypothetical protein